MAVVFSQYNKAKKIAFIVAIAAALCWMFASLNACGPDVGRVFRPTAAAYLRGETRLYDGNAPGFFFAPWSIYPLLVTAWLPLSWGWSILAVVNLAGILLAIRAVNEEHTGYIAPLLALANIPTLALITAGNIDGIMAGGVGLAWLAVKNRRPWMLGFALLIMSCKPINVALVTLLFLRLAWRWTSRERMAALAPTCAALALSFPLFGVDWPVRYVQAMSGFPPFVSPQIGLWRLLAWLEWPTWPAYIVALAAFVGGACAWMILKTNRLDERVLALTLCLTLVSSVYILTAHLVLLAPIFVWLVTQNRKWLWLWPLTLAPFCGHWGNDLAWMVLAYPLALLLATVCTRRRGSLPQRVGVSY